MKNSEDMGIYILIASIVVMNGIGLGISNYIIIPILCLLGGLEIGILLSILISWIKDRHTARSNNARP
jgi:hypothetical protein